MSQEATDNGWENIHFAATRGYTKSIARFVAGDPEQLEIETGDGTNSTPLLLAVSSGNIESVKCLIELGAKSHVINSQNQGVIELCVAKHHINLIEYFLHVDLEKLPVWKKLLHIISSESDEEVEKSGKCLQILTQPNDSGVNPHCRELLQHKAIPTLLKVTTANVIDDAKIPVFQTILNLMEIPGVVDDVVTAGGIATFIQMLKSDNVQFLRLSARILKLIGNTTKYADQEAQSNAIPAMLSILKSSSDVTVHVEIVEALGNIARSSPRHQTGIVQSPGAVETIVSLFNGCTHKPLMMCLTSTVSSIVTGNMVNQNAFVEQRVTGFIVILARLKPIELQLNAVDALHQLANDNPQTQSTMITEGADKLLLLILKKCRSEALLEKTGCALWALAGDDLDLQKSMATSIGVHMLIEFLNSNSEHLHFIGSEGIGVLAQGPNNHKAAIASASGIYPLVRHLCAYKEHIVLSVIRTLRHLCVGIGYVPQRENQTTISYYQGIHWLVPLMIHPVSTLIQVEAALTLAILALGNSSLLREIKSYEDFSYSRILTMLYSKDAMVRLLAGLALATFSYNNIDEQRKIAEDGGIRFDCFVPFLQSDNELFRCLSAFQIVVLARIIPDEEQANSSAVGIKLLVDLIQESQSDTILALAADCLARLGHTRAGIPAAIVAIDAVDLLCDLITYNTESVQGCAAIALAYLSFNYKAERKLLNSEGKVSLISPTPGYMVAKESSALSESDTRNSSNLPSSQTRLNLMGEDSSHSNSQYSMTARSSILEKSSPTTSAQFSVSDQGSICYIPLHL